MIQRFISFFTAILITRYLGPEKYGQYVFVISLITITAVFWNFGLNTYLIRESSKTPEQIPNLMGDAIQAKAFLGFAILVLLLFTLHFLGYASTILICTAVFGFGEILIGIAGVFQSAFTAARRMEFAAIVSFIRGAILLAAIIVVTSLSGGVVQVFFAYLVTFVLMLLYWVFVAKRFLVMPSFKIDFRAIVAILKNGTPFLMITMVNIILFRIDHLMLSKMQGDKVVGFYGAAYTLFEVIISLLPFVIMHASFPVLAEKHKTDIGGMTVLYNLLLKYHLFFGIPIGAGMLILGDAIIITLYGDAFEPAGILLSCLGVAVWIFFLTTLVSWTLTAMDKQNIVLKSNAIAMVLNIVTNLFAIPAYGALGAAVTTSACELFQLVFMYWHLQKNLTLSYQFGIFRIAIGAFIMTGFILIVKNYFLPWHPTAGLILLVGASAAIYFGVALVIRTVNMKELKLLLH
jgi:O-antigen/teichoic acid export membrane protein